MGPHRPCFLLNAQSHLSRGLKNSQGAMQPQEPKVSQSPLDQSIPPNQHLDLDPSPQFPAQQCGPSPPSLAGLLTNQACSPAWPSLQRRTKSISVSHKSCLTQAPGIAPKVLLGGISTSRHGQAPTSFTVSAFAVRALHPFSLCTTSSSHCLPLSSCLAPCGLFNIQNSGWTFSDSKAVRAGLSEGWHSSCIFGAHCAFLRKDPNTEPALGMASLLPHGWLRWRLLPKDTGIQEQERHFSLRPANCHIMPSNRQTLSLQRC